MLRIDQVRKLSGGEWLTKLQWLSRGYVPDESKGKWFRANSCFPVHKFFYFSSADVRFDPDAAKRLLSEIHRAYKLNTIENRKRREEKEREKAEREAELQREEDEEWDFWLDCNTAWQWVSQGYVPSCEKKAWQSGPVDYEYEKILRKRDHYFLPGNYDKSPYYYYCHVSNVVYDLERAKELLTLYDKMVAGMALPPPLEVYDGRPWWC